MSNTRNPEEMGNNPFGKKAQQIRPSSAQTNAGNLLGGDGSGSGGNDDGGVIRVGSGGNGGDLHEEFNWQSIRPLWSSYPDYKEVEYDNEKYAEVAGRLYRAHAITRMLPRGLGPAAGEQGKKDNSGTKNRSVSPHIVEHAIRYGEKVESFKPDKPGGEMVRYGDVEVITYDGGRIVDTVIINK